VGALAAAARPRTIELKAGAPATADLAVPGWPTVARALCPDSTLRPNRGILVGAVHGLAGDTALVSATWTRTIVGGGGTRSNTQFLATRPDAQGFYVLCGVPEGRPLQVGMRRGGVDEGGTEVTLRAGTPRRQDISATGEVAARAEPDLTDVKAVAAAAGVPIRTAEAPAGQGALAGFERRRQSGRGVYLARADVERRHAVRLADLFRGMAGVQVLQDPAGERVVMTGARGARFSDQMQMRPTTDSLTTAPSRPGANVGRTAEPEAPACSVQLFVDGTYTATDRGHLSNEVEPGDVEAVEVYRSAAETPAEFRRQGATCGVIVIWTRHYARRAGR
jgi:hypothetical protein